MKKFLFFLFAFLLIPQSLSAQDVFFQTGHTNDIQEVKFSPDDSRLISYSAGDGWFCLWNVNDGRLIWKTETGFIRKNDESINLKEFYWSEDGKFLVTKSVNETYQTWDAQTGKILALSETKPEINLITPDKKDISYTKDFDNITISDSESDEIKKIKRFGYNSSFDTSNDGTMFAEGGGYGDGSVKITNIKTEKSWWLDAHPGIIHALEFSPDGNFLAVAGNDKNIYVFDVQKHNLIKILAGHQKPVEKIAFSLDGNLLISSAAHDALKIWNWQNAEVVKNKKSDDKLRFASNIIALDSDGKQLITKYDIIAFEIRDTQNWEVLREFKTKEKYVERGAGSKLRWDAVPIYSIQLSKNRKNIFANYADGKIRVWDINQEKPVRVFKYADDGCWVRFTADEKKILTVCGINSERKIKLIDLAAGKIIKSYAVNDEADDEISFDTEFIKTIVVSPNGKYFLTSEISGDVLLWDLNKSKPIREFEIGFSGDDAIAFSPDGKTFAVGGLNQNLFLFDVETGNKLWQLIPSYEPNELEIKLRKEYYLRRSQAGKNKIEANLPK